MSSNFSDDEEEPIIAKGRSEEWSDDEDGDVDLIKPSEARAQEDSSWSDDGEPDVTAGALFGSKSDPVGALRTKAKNLNRSAIDAVDKYVRRSGDEAKKVRAARKKIATLRNDSLKAVQRTEKDKTLSESAKAAQRSQHEAFTKPTTGDLAQIDKGLEEQEAWLNQLLSMRRLPASAAIAPRVQRSMATARATKAPTVRDAAPKVETNQLGPHSSTGTKVLSQTALAYIPKGTRLTRDVGGKSVTHEAREDGDHFHVKAGSAFTVSNGGNRTVAYKLFYH